MTGQGVCYPFASHWFDSSDHYLQINLNVIAQLVPGTLLPGNPLANMIFKAYSVQTLAAGTSFVQDLKLGHYVKVPPRATFMGM